MGNVFSLTIEVIVLILNVLMHFAKTDDTAQHLAFNLFFMLICITHLRKQLQIRDDVKPKKKHSGCLA